MLKLFYICLLLSFSAFAQEARWSSFGTLGITLSDSDVYGYRNDIGSDNGVFSGDIDYKSHSLIGAQYEVAFTPKLDFVGQVVLRDITDAKFSDYITMGFLRYTPSASWSLKLGRLSPDLFPITEYRNINVAYTWANVPNEIYGMIPFKYLDGGEVSYTQRLHNGTLNIKIFGGVSQSTVAAQINETLEIRNAIGSSFIYDQNDWNLQARYTQAEIGNDGEGALFLSQQINNIPDILWPNKSKLTNDLLVKGKVAEYISLSGQKYWNNWLFNFELAQIDSESESTSQIHAGYISSAYQIDAHTYYGVYAQTRANNYSFDEAIDRNLIPELVFGIEQVMNFYSSNQQTLSIGWRWDISPLITSKLQINRTKIDSNGSTLWLNPTASDTGETINSAMFTLSFAL